jgi:hypothetical protein
MSASLSDNFKDAMYTYVQNNSQHLENTMYADYNQDTRYNDDDVSKHTYNEEQFLQSKIALHRIVEDTEFTLSSTLLENLVNSDIPEILLKVLKNNKAVPTKKALRDFRMMYGEEKCMGEGLIGEIHAELLKHIAI